MIDKKYIMYLGIKEPSTETEIKVEIAGLRQVIAAAEEQIAGLKQSLAIAELHKSQQENKETESD